MNITSTYILKIENGKQTGSVELAVELAAFFDVSLDYLLSGREFKAMKNTAVMSCSKRPTSVTVSAER